MRCVREAFEVTYKRIIFIVMLCSVYGISYAQDADLMKSNAILFEGKKQFKEAAENYEAAYKAYEKNGIVDTLCVFKAGQNFVRSDQFENSLNYINRSIEINYNDPRTFLLLAEAYEGLSRVEEAEVSLQNGMEKYPDSKSEYIKALSYLYFNSNQFDKAVSSLKNAVEEEPTNVTYRYLYASSFEKLKDYKSATSQFEQLLLIDPNHKQSIRKLGFIYFKQTDYQYKNEKKRYEAISKPTRVDYHNSTTKLNSIKKGYEKALPFLEKSYAINQKDKTIQNCLSVCYKRLKMDEKVKGL